MKIIVAGGREFKTDEHYQRMCDVLDKFQNDMDGEFELVYGCARGADTLAYNWAISKGLKIHAFPAQWKKHKGEKYDLNAGFKRNIEMAEFADALIAFWDGESKGTKHMIKEARKRGLPVLLELYSPYSTGII